MRTPYALPKRTVSLFIYSARRIIQEFRINSIKWKHCVKSSLLCSRMTRENRKSIGHLSPSRHPALDEATLEYPRRRNFSWSNPRPPIIIIALHGRWSRSMSSTICDDLSDSEGISDCFCWENRLSAMRNFQDALRDFLHNKISFKNYWWVP